jgi:uncharacterized protein (TIGR02266 family)
VLTIARPGLNTPCVADLPLVRVRLKYPDVDTLVDRFAANVTRGGIFLASRDPKPVGAQIRFEVSLLGGTCVLAGEGRVTWVKPYDPSAPTRPHGMGVSFTRLDSGSRDMFRKLVERRELGAARKAAAPAQPIPRRTTRDLVAPDLEGMDDLALRRAADRARVLAGDLSDVEVLLVEEAEAPPVDSKDAVKDALTGLSRYLQPRRSLTPTRTPAVTGAETNGTASANGKDDVTIDVDLDEKH